MSTIPDTPNIPHVDVSRQIGQQIREVVQKLDGFVFLSANERLRVNTSATLPDRFLESVAGAMESSSALASSTSLTPFAIRDVIAYSQAYFSLADELERLARGVRETVKNRRAVVGTEALRVYSVAKRLNRPSDREEVVPWVNHMQRALNRGRRKQVEESTTTPPPVEKQPVPGGAS